MNRIPGKRLAFVAIASIAAKKSAASGLAKKSFREIRYLET
jgi:hypothetical protein